MNGSLITKPFLKFSNEKNLNFSNEKVLNFLFFFQIDSDIPILHRDSEVFGLSPNPILCRTPARGNQFRWTSESSKLKTSE